MRGRGCAARGRSCRQKANNHANRGTSRAPLKTRGEKPRRKKVEPLKVEDKRGVLVYCRGEEEEEEELVIFSFFSLWRGLPFIPLSLCFARARVGSGTALLQLNETEPGIYCSPLLRYHADQRFNSCWRFIKMCSRCGSRMLRAPGAPGL